MEIRPEDHARHLKNRDDLLAARAALQAGWEAEDAKRDSERAEHLASFDRGLADFAAATGIEAEPVAAEPEPPPAVDPSPDPVG